MSRVTEAQEVLKSLGLPKPQQNEISALTLLALCGLRKRDPWQKAKRRSLTIRKGIMEFVNTNYRRYAENTRETFRRQVLHQFVHAGIVEHNPDDPSLPTNSSRNHYALRPDFVQVLRTYGTQRWNAAVRRFLDRNPTLVEIYSARRDQTMLPVSLPDGTQLRLSPGKHNRLQASVMNEFAPRFVRRGCLLYLGDTADKTLHINHSRLEQLGVSVSEHDKLPDLILYDETRFWLFLIEVVTSHGPMSPKRVRELEALFSRSKAGLVFVTAFPDFRRFKQYANQLAWETEVWIAELPDHLIHYNGDRFLGPR